tara:strand:- start:18251 stop:19558 length:1308 start_codon:yes stop_codon:yes gene_type:complete
MKIGVIGLGFVGLSLATVLASKDIHTIGIDTDKEKCKKISKGIPPFFEPSLEKILKISLKKKFIISNDFSLLHDCEFIFVTVGTPQRKNGTIDLSLIKTASKQIGQVINTSKKRQTIIIKSTVIPGTISNTILPILENFSHKKANKDFGLISNPEFLQESSAIKDTKFPHAIILGGKKNIFMNKFYNFLKKIHPNISIIITNFQSAEIIKYANNSFLATKITFINQLSNICQKIPEANIDDISKAIGLDPRIGSLFLNAGPGYGGSCLPKDMKALINFSKQVGIKPLFLDAVEKTNSNQVEQIIKLTKQKLGKIHSKKISVLGLAFKPDTDDIRDSISITLLRKLIRNNVIITVHDPKAIENTKKIFSNKIKYTKSIDDALTNSECVIIMTPWKEYSKINNRLIGKMKKKVIIDSRRILVNSNLNCDYSALGIGS